MPCKDIQERLIYDFRKKKRPPGRSNYTVRNSLINYIRKIIPSVKDDESFNSWANIANNELVWSILINNIDQHDPRPSNYDPEWDGNILESNLPLKLLYVFLRLFPEKYSPPQNLLLTHDNTTDFKICFDTLNINPTTNLRK